MLLAGCAALPRVTPAQVEIAQRQDSAVDEAVLVADRLLYARRCGSCHAAYLPQAYTATQWPSRVEGMAKRAKLAPGERERMLRWLLAARMEYGP